MHQRIRKIEAMSLSQALKLMNDTGRGGHSQEQRELYLTWKAQVLLMRLGTSSGIDIFAVVISKNRRQNVLYCTMHDEWRVVERYFCDRMDIWGWTVRSIINLLSKANILEGVIYRKKKSSSVWRLLKNPPTECSTSSSSGCIGDADALSRLSQVLGSVQSIEERICSRSDFT